MHNDLDKVLVTEQQIKERIAELGAEISSSYKPGDELSLVAVINGAILFAADLIRQITIPVSLDCMRVSSYQDATSPQQAPEIIDMLRLDLEGRHVIIVDDILDTGHTMKKVCDEIRKLRPASLKFAVLLEKSGRREVHMKPDFVGFRIPDEFVVGYGLDFAEQYRQLPMIGVLKPECQNPPVWI